MLVITYVVIFDAVFLNILYLASVSLIEYHAFDLGTVTVTKPLLNDCFLFQTLSADEARSQVATEGYHLQSSKVTATMLAAKPTPKHRLEPVSVNEDHHGLPETSEPSGGDKETHAAMEERPSQLYTASTFSTKPVHHLETYNQAIAKSKIPSTVEDEPFPTACPTSLSKHGRRAGFTEDDEHLLEEYFVKELKDKCAPTSIVRRRLEACLQLRDIKKRFWTKTIVDKLRYMMLYPRPENIIC
jgi:hypothetical protein